MEDNGSHHHYMTSKIKIGLIKQLPTVPPPPEVVPSTSISSSLGPQPQSENETFDSLRKLNGYLHEIVENNVFVLFVELLKKIGQDYQIPFDQLKDRYLNYFKKDLKNSNLYAEFLSMNLTTIDLKHLTEGTQGGPEKSQSESASETETSSVSSSGSINEAKCCARTASGLQCSRKKQKNSPFCGSHAHGQPYGRVDQQPTTSTPTSTPTSTTSPVSPDMEAVVEEIDGISYVVDNQSGNIYQFPEDADHDADEIDLTRLTLVGKKVDEDINWLS